MVDNDTVPVVGAERAIWGKLRALTLFAPRGIFNHRRVSRHATHCRRFTSCTPTIILTHLLYAAGLKLSTRRPSRESSIRCVPRWERSLPLI